MNLKKSLLLSLLSLSLVGCNPTPDASPDISNTGTEGESQTGNNDNNDKSDKDNNDQTDKKPEEDKKDDNKDDKPDDGTVVNNTNWKNEYWNAMRQYLGGNVLPYIYLGKGIEFNIGPGFAHGGCLMA